MHNIEEQLTSCDKEPIHIIGGIQPHGAFIAFHAVTGKIMHASRNAGEYLTKNKQSPVGKRLLELFSEQQAKQILTVSSRVLPHYIKLERVGAEERTFEVMLFKIDGLIAAEFEPLRKQHQEEVDSASNLQMRTKDFLAQLSSQSDLSEAARVTCRAIREFTGFDRVMCYRFLPNWDGEVIAEDKVAEAQSFMYHFFPATDIPAQARKLYFLNRTRLIADAMAAPVAIEPSMHAVNGHPIDLSQSKLRAVSNMHLEYLRNMGVVASASFAIINNDQLWGLFACHSSKPNYLSYEDRLTCEAASTAFALAAVLLEANSKQRVKIEFETKLKQIFSELRLKTEPLQNIFRNSDEYLRLFRATGMAFVSKGKIDIAGLTPPTDQVQSISSLVRVQMQTKRQTVVAIQSLAQLDSQFETVSQISSGLLALSIPELDDALFLFFRPERLTKVMWGGNPYSLDKRTYSGQINPRKSFDSWTETVRKNSEPWEQYEVGGMQFMREFVFDSLIKKDLLIQELGRQLGSR